MADNEMCCEVVIPTVAGREKYLEWCLKSCLQQQCAEKERVAVLVSNNGGSATVRETVLSFADPRVRLVETDRLLPMALHWEFALSHARGDVITIIGDDDALIPGCVARVLDLFARHPDIDCITHWPAQYYWPDYLVDELRNRYFVRQGDGITTIVETAPVLQKVVEFKSWYGNLPFLYHGFVRRQALEAIISSHGGLFKRISPDIYSDLLLASYLERFLRVNDTLTIGGQGSRSNGANFLLDTPLGQEFLYDLPELLRPVYCPKSINLQVFEYISMVDKCLAMHRAGKPDWMSLARNTAMEAVFLPAHRAEILEGLSTIAVSEFPTLQRFVTKLVICALSTYGVAALARMLVDWRHQRSMGHWPNAMTQFGATNVFELSLHLSPSSDEPKVIAVG
jgi:glycosyltransferase involved in cell wall biosynthesis